MARKCDLCGVTTGTEIEPKVFVCDGCGFVHVKERRSPAEIAAAWSEVYNSGAYDPNWPGVKARLFYVAEWLDQKYGLKGKSVLDIGAGKGVFLDYARVRGAVTAGIEPDAGNADMVRAKGHGCFTGMIEDVAEPLTVDVGWFPESAQMDIVTILWTLENCGDCIDFLNHARNFLKDDGILVVATGSRILVPYKKPYSSYFGELSPDLHCYRWTPKSLSAAFDASFLEWVYDCSPYGNRGINNWRENDVLLMVAKRADGSCLSPKDDPKEVVDFFRSWKEIFP